MLTAANVNDRKGAVDMINYYCRNTDYLSDIKKVLVDGGYSGENFAGAVKEISNAEVEVVKRNELHKFIVLPKRWIVERSFSWLDKFWISKPLIRSDNINPVFLKFKSIC